MSFEAKKWQETEGPCLRNFDEKEAIESVQGALALRPQIEAVIDRNAGGGLYARPLFSAHLC